MKNMIQWTDKVQETGMTRGEDYLKDPLFKPFNYLSRTEAASTVESLLD